MAETIDLETDDGRVWTPEQNAAAWRLVSEALRAATLRCRRSPPDDSAATGCQRTATAAMPGDAGR